MSMNDLRFIPSFFSVSRPTDFSDCLGDELPVGWEQVFDYQTGGVYYVDHINSKSFLWEDD